MIDFAALNTPEGKAKLAEARRRREAEEAAQQARDKSNKFMVDHLRRIDDALSAWESSFVRSVHVSLTKGFSLTEAQEQKLSQIFEKW